MTGCSVVTGGAGGIGHAISLRLAAAGHTVCVGYHTRQTDAESVVTEIQGAGGTAMAAKCDVADPVAVGMFFDRIEAEIGCVSVLVNNAGTTADGLAVQLTDAEWDQTIRVNTTGAFLCSRRVLMPMIRHRHGRIINVASVSAIRAYAGQVNYAASKAALIALTRGLAVEVARRGVTVNAVAPGVIETAMAEAVPDAVRAAIPTRRPGTPQEVAGCVAFLASDEASYVNGAVLTVDGGLSA